MSLLLLFAGAEPAAVSPVPGHITLEHVKPYSVTVRNLKPGTVHTRSTAPGRVTVTSEG